MELGRGDIVLRDDRGHGLAVLRKADDVVRSYCSAWRRSARNRKRDCSRGYRRGSDGRAPWPPCSSPYAGSSARDRSASGARHRHRTSRARDAARRHRHALPRFCASNCMPRHTARNGLPFSRTWRSSISSMPRARILSHGVAEGADAGQDDVRGVGDHVGIVGHDRIEAAILDGIADRPHIVDAVVDDRNV